MTHTHLPMKGKPILEAVRAMPGHDRIADPLADAQATIDGLRLELELSRGETATAKRRGDEWFNRYVQARDRLEDGNHNHRAAFWLGWCAGVVCGAFVMLVGALGVVAF